MIRRYNYTGRVKIPRGRADISILNDKGGKYFSAKLHLEDFEFPGDSKVFIEPYYKSFYKRFSFGTVGNIEQPGDTSLNDLPITDIVYFDVSVVDEKSEVGLLLGKARGIIVSTDGLPNDRIPLLPVNSTDLGNQFWKLSFDSGSDGGPILEINRNIPDLSEMAKNDIKFISLVYPAAMREVLTKLIETGDYDAEEDSWVSNWIKFTEILGIKNLPDSDNENDEMTPEQEQWIDDCVDAYCKKMGFFEKFVSL